MTPKIINDKNHQLELKERKIESLRKAHTVLFECENWYTLGFNVHGSTPLFALSKNGAHKVCCIGDKDVLLVGIK